MPSLRNGLGGPAGFGETYLVRNDDGYTNYLDLRSIFGAQGINFFGQNYTGLWLNNNGSVTFASGMSTYTPTAITGNTTNPIIAAYWGDVDTRGGVVTATPGGTSTGTNLLWFDLDAATQTFTATWDDVGYFSSYTNRLNAFQLVIHKVDDNGDFDIDFIYENIDWVAGTASGGVDGLGGAPAHIGYSSGNGVNYFELSQSGNQEALRAIEGDSNIGMPGIYHFEVRNGAGTPAISVGDISVVEGNGDTPSYAVVSVFLASPSSDPITVQYQTANGTATAGSDYVAQGGVLTFAPGVTQQNIFVELVGDTIVENDETFLINLSNATGAPIADASGTVTILNDDGLVVSDVTKLEGTGASPTAFTFTVSLLSASTSPVTVNYATESGTATSGTDFTAATGSLTFAAGETTKTVTVNVTADSLSEANETFNLRLSGATGAAIADAVGLGTILNDDGLVIDDVSIVEGTGGTVTANVTVRLITAASGPVSVDWATAGGTATSGTDFTAGSGTLNFAAGETTKTISIPITTDSIIEPTESFTVTLSNASGAAIVDGEATVRILDDDGIAVSDAVLTEPAGSGTATMAFTVSLGSALTTTTTVNYATADGTATAGSDYVAASGTLTFAPGVTTQTVYVTIKGDGVPENDESFTLNLSNPSGAGIVDGTGTGTIFNYDGLYVGNTSVTEGNSGTVNATVLVTLSGASTTPVTVHYTTQDGTGVAGVDYSPVSGTLTFAPGETSKSVSIAVLGDTVFEGNETFRLVLSDPTNTNIVDGTGTITIVNDDTRPPPSFRVVDAALLEGTGGGTSVMRFQVVLSEATTSDATVHYATSDGTAVAGSDYTAATGTLTIAAGDVYGFIDVAVSRDAVIEPNESFTLTLSTPSSGTAIDDGSATGTILNDDSSYAIAATSANKAEGNSGSTPFTFTVTRTGYSDGSETLNWGVAGSGGNAANAADFTGNALPTGTVTFAAGETSKVVTINVAGDTAVESNEGFTVTLSNPSAGGTITTASASGTIQNDDTVSASTLAIAATSANKAEGNSGTTAFTFTVTRSGSTDIASSATWTVSSTEGNAPATASDFSGNSLPTGTVNFAVGETSKVITVNVAGDTVVESNEGFTVTLSAPSANTTITTASAAGTIQNDDTAPPSGGGTITFSEQPVGTVNPVYTFADNVVHVIGQIVTDNAQPGSPVAAANTSYDGPVYITFDNAVTHVDFLAGYFDNLQSTTIEFIGVGGTVLQTVQNTGLGVRPFSYDAAGGITAVRVIDTTADANGFSVDTVNFSGALTPVTVTSTVSIVAASADKAEGNSGTTPFTFTVTRTGDTSKAGSVGYGVSTTGANPADADDFAGGNFPIGTVNFAAGETTKTVTIGIAGDTVIEGNESFAVTLFGASSGMTVGTGSATGTIREDDQPQSLTITPATAGINEGNSGTTALSFTVTRGGDTSNGRTVNWAVAGSGDHAANGADFVNGVLPTGSVVFAAGETVKMITVNIAGDFLVESSEGFTVTLTDPGQATALATASGTIRNDDPSDAQDEINGTANADTLIGLGGDDTLNGAGGNDTLDGGSGTNRLIGGTGDDVILSSGARDSIDAGTGNDQVLFASTALLGGIVQGGDGEDTLIFSGASFDASSGAGGFSGFEHIYGQLNGTAGNDVLILSGLDSPTLAANSLTVQGGDGDDRISTGAETDFLYGGNGDDRLNGGLGADTLTGGIGNDYYLVDNAGDKVIENNNEGLDTIESSVDYALSGTYVEILRLTGTAVAGTGNSQVNTLIGNSGSNVLDGAGGADTMQGGKGEDVYFVDNVGDVVIELDGEGSDTINSSVTYSLAGQYVEVLNLTGSAAINGTGNSLANRIVGNAAANTLVGGDGNDRLDGGAGADILKGGIGNDTYVIDVAGDQVFENDGEGTDTVEAWISFNLTGQYIEILKLMGTANLTGSGNGLANTLYGNSGNNTLNGAGGADTMYGGAGDDVFIVDNAGDRVFEYANEGTDTVQSSVTFAIGGQYIETVTLTGTAAINATGNSQANRLNGNSAVNVLNGGAGDDGLHGGLGSDTLTGGAGLDTYWFETALGATNVDTITDFNVADDTIYLDRTIFSGIAVDGALSAAAFFQGAAAHDTDDRIVYDKATGKIWYDADGTGAGAAVLFAQVTANTALTAADFFAVP